MSCTQSEWNCGHFRAIALVTLSAAVLFMTATTARATISEVQIAAVSVSSSLGSGEFDVKVPFDPSGQYSYLSGPDPIAIYSNDANHNLLATIQPYGLSVTLDSDPTAGLSFGVLAANTPTNFTISTSSVVFGAIPSPSAVASAALTVTDVDSNGASITGAYPGSLAFQALSNQGTFAYLAPSISATAEQSIASTPNVPPTTGTIIGAVTSIQSNFSFQLSANDLGSGSGTFSVPEPGTFGMLAVASLGLLVMRRRRS
jgi:hypothetical protein